LNVKKDRTMFVSTCIIKWKASIVTAYSCLWDKVNTFTAHESHVTPNKYSFLHPWN